MIAHYGSSHWTGLFEHHIARYDGEMRALLLDLRSYNARYFEVLVATREGERITDYARRMGITLGAAKMRKQRARAWARQWITGQECERRARRDAERDAWDTRHPTPEGEAA